jgi:3-hydroxyacyl-[acyl-carrier-protein] dehydratase
MPPPLLFDLGGIDTSKLELTKEEVYDILPHRHEFMLLDGMCYLDRERHRGVALVEITPDAWWARGHVPGMPLLPGVLMLEMAGQAMGLVAKLSGLMEGFIAFGGVQECKFRDSVVPPSRMYILTESSEVRSRRTTARAQGIADDRLIFEATISGMRYR